MWKERLEEIRQEKRYGWGIEKDLAQAVRYYTQAAEQGQPREQYRLGVFFAKGTGLDLNGIP